MPNIPGYCREKEESGKLSAYIYIYIYICIYIYIYIQIDR